MKSAVLQVIALAHYAIVYARAWAADSINARMRLSAENDRLQEECVLLREELRIKDTRTAQIAPQPRALGISGYGQRRSLSLCSDARQVGVLQHLHCEDADLLLHVVLGPMI